MEVAAVAFVLLGAAVWNVFRRQGDTAGGPLPDVPDASPSAVPIEAPGMTLPYSSLDPFAPRKPRANRAPAEARGAPGRRVVLPDDRSAL
jgi:hypothetical protein